MDERTLWDLQKQNGRIDMALRVQKWLVDHRHELQPQAVQELAAILAAASSEEQ
jgi:hypothetical protein